MRVQAVIKRATAMMLLTAAGPLLAADYVFTIKEKGRGTPVEGATVVLDEGENYAETGARGEVRFSDIDRAGKLKILAAGYETLQVDAPATAGSHTLYIYPLVVEGLAVEVTADRIEEKASKIQLSTQELTETAGTQGDPLKVISALPGVVTGSGFGGGQIYMRGSNGNENAVWVNRAPLGYLYHLGGMYSTIHPALVQDMNIFLAGYPVEYNDVLGGVVDVQLKTPKKDRVQGRVDVSTIMASFMLEGPAGAEGEDSFYLAARRSYFDLILSPSDLNDMMDNQDEEDPDRITLVPHFYDAQGLYRKALDNGSIDTYFFTAGDIFEMDIRSSAASDPQLAGEFSSERAYTTVGTTWRQRWSERFSQEAVLAYYNTDSRFQIGSDDSGAPYYVDFNAHTLWLQPEFSWRPNADSSYSFDAGMASYFTEVPLDLYISRPPSEEDPNFDLTQMEKYRIEDTLNTRTVAPYVKYHQYWTDSFKSSLGLRYNDSSISGGFHDTAWLPRAGLEYQLTDSTLLTATWGQYIQHPEAYAVTDGFGNPALLFTKAEHRVLGIQQQLTPLYSLTLELYQKPMRDLVVPVDGNPPPDNFANEGSGEAYGFDIFLKRQAQGRRVGWLSLSWARSERTNELTGLTREFSGDQPLTMTAVWGQPFGGNWKRWDWSIKAQARSGKPYTEVLGRHREDPNDDTSRWIPEMGRHNAARTPNFYQLDLRITRQMLTDENRVKLYLDIQNVLNIQNVTDYDYGNEYEDIDNPTEVTGMGFFPFLGVEVEF